MAKKSAPLLELPVEFGGYSDSGKTARLGFSFSRSNMTPNQASKQLCGRRIRGRIKALPNSNGDDADQGRLFDDAVELAITFDIKAVTMTPIGFSSGLSFNANDVKGGKLEPFVKRQGALTVEEEIGDAADDEVADE